VRLGAHSPVRCGAARVPSGSGEQSQDCCRRQGEEGGKGHLGCSCRASSSFCGGGSPVCGSDEGASGRGCRANKAKACQALLDPFTHILCLLAASRRSRTCASSRSVVRSSELLTPAGAHQAWQGTMYLAKNYYKFRCTKEKGKGQEQRTAVAGCTRGKA